MYCFCVPNVYFCRKNRVMQIITTREFRANQKKYFELAEKEPVYVTRKNGRPAVISIAEEDDILTNGELASIKQGLDDIKNGKSYRMQVGESLADFINRVGACIR